MDQKRGRGSGGCHPAPDDAVYHSLCHALDAVQPAADAEKAVNFHLSICNNQKPHLPDAECSARQAGLFLFLFLAFSPGTATVLQQASPCHRKNTDLIFFHYYKSSKSSETAFASREWQSRIFTKNSPLQTMECRILCRYTNSIRQFA
jgi:hypothetical protein